MIIIAGTIDFETAAQRDAALDLGRPLQRKTRDEEPGCLAYVFAADPCDAKRIGVYELWRDEASLAAHFKHPNYTNMRDALVRSGIKAADNRKYRVDHSEPVYDPSGVPRADFFTLAKRDTEADRFALQDVMLNYTSGVDERDFVRYRNCFADDAVIVGFTPQPIVGANAWLDFVVKALDQYASTQHLLGLQRATIGGDRARARTDVQAQHFMKEPKDATLTLWATYETEFARIDGAWKITRHELKSRGMRRA